jgi:hypothetical protein
MHAGLETVAIVGSMEPWHASVILPGWAFLCEYLLLLLPRDCTD